MPQYENVTRAECQIIEEDRIKCELKGIGDDPTATETVFASGYMFRDPEFVSNKMVGHVDSFNVAEPGDCRLTEAAGGPTLKCDGDV